MSNFDSTNPVAVLRDMADRIDRGPDVPLPPNIFSALVRERADDLETEGPVLIWSNQKGMWWRPGERGYTSHLGEAGRYPRQHARRIVAGATCDGALVHDRVDPVTGEAYRELDEVIVPAPAS